MKFVISWISFFDSVLHLEQIVCLSEQDALQEAYLRLVGTWYLPEIDGATDIKQAAFDCDGMIGALEIK